MPFSSWQCAGAILAMLLVAASPPTAYAAQPDPNVLVNIDSLQDIPAPSLVNIQPRLFAAYGALIAAAMLTILYLYRGGAFVVYWIGSWVLIAGSLGLQSRGYQDVQLGRVMFGLAQLLGVWSAGLMLRAGRAFPDAPLRWDWPLKAGAATAVWFLATPFVLPLTAVMSTGPAAAAVLFGWSALRYLGLARRTRYVGSALIGSGTALMAVSNAAVAGVVLNLDWGAGAFDRLLAVNVVTHMFIALGMHVLIFEDMTGELRRTNRRLEEAHGEVKRVAITDPLTGCHNRRFFDEIERRELQRHRRYGTPISILFVDINHFKRLNDTMGHNAGDEILRMLGPLLRKQVRESDYVIRWGGDEFLLLLTCGIAEAQQKAEELKLAFDNQWTAVGLTDGLGLSIGVAAVSPAAESLADAIRLADSLMYRDKVGDSG